MYGMKCTTSYVRLSFQLLYLNYPFPPIFMKQNIEKTKTVLLPCIISCSQL